jgi:GR25 family glycosyltransferase involved in LPS biosynthesis
MLEDIPNLAVQRIQAVYGPDLPAAASVLLWSNPSSPPRRGTLGTFLSHVKAWEAVACGTETYGVILEDDAMLLGFERLISFPLPEDAELVFINDRMSPGSRHAPPTGPIMCFPIAEALRSLNKTGQGVGGDGYILTKVGARKLLETVAKDRFFGHVDWRLLRYSVKAEDLHGEFAGTRVSEIIPHHHSKAFPPAWGVLRAYCLNKPLVAFGTGGTSTREEADQQR